MGQAWLSMFTWSLPWNTWMKQSLSQSFSPMNQSSTPGFLFDVAALQEMLSVDNTLWCQWPNDEKKRHRCAQLWHWHLSRTAIDMICIEVGARQWSVVDANDWISECWMEWMNWLFVRTSLLLTPFSQGGAFTIENGQATMTNCNFSSNNANNVSHEKHNDDAEKSEIMSGRLSRLYIAWLFLLTIGGCALKHSCCIVTTPCRVCWHA